MVLQAANLTKVYGVGPTEVRALRGVTVEVRRGEFVAIMGASGSGKSTLLQILGGLDSPSAGRVLIAGQDLSSLTEARRTLLRREQIGFVFQSYNLISVLSAEENVSLPLTLAGVKAPEALGRARRALKLVGLEERAQHLPGQLSGGQQQRVAVARALVTEPAMLLADEPTGNLDSRTGLEIMELLRRSCDELGQTVVLVTHDARAATYADRVLFLRDGQVVQEACGRSQAEILATLHSLGEGAVGQHG